MTNTKLNKLEKDLKTSSEVLLEIANITTKKRPMMEIWEFPTREEKALIIKRALDKNGNEYEYVFWGDERILSSENK